jgi:hypothetical protein
VAERWCVYRRAAQKSIAAKQTTCYLDATRTNTLCDGLERSTKPTERSTSTPSPSHYLTQLRRDGRIAACGRLRSHVVGPMCGQSCLGSKFWDHRVSPSVSAPTCGRWLVKWESKSLSHVRSCRMWTRSRVVGRDEGEAGLGNHPQQIKRPAIWMQPGQGHHDIASSGPPVLLAIVAFA